MKSLLLDVYEDKVKELDIEPELSEYYKAIGCDLIDMVDRKIGRKRYTIICDDEGLFREDVRISAINNLGGVMLVGNLMFVKTGEEGETLGLEKSDIEYISKRIQKMYTTKHPEGYKMLTCCEY